MGRPHLSFSSFLAVSVATLLNDRRCLPQAARTGLQTPAEEESATSQQEAESVAPSIAELECPALWVTQSTFKHAGPMVHSVIARQILGNVQDSQPWLHDAGWVKAQDYISNTLGNTDRAELWAHPSHKCILGFRGSSSVANIISLFNTQNITFHGLEGVRAGVAEMLDRMLNELKVTKVGPDSTREYISTFCTDTFAVAGTSFGGAVASVLAALINKKTDPLNWPRKVDLLLTTGAPVMSTHMLQNEQSSDGCFAGASYYNMRDNKVDEEFNDGRESGFVDAKIPVVFLKHDQGSRSVIACSKNRHEAMPARDHVVFPDLHMPDDYGAGLGCTTE